MVSNRLLDGEQRLAARMRGRAATSIVYERDGTTLELTATVGEFTFRVENLADDWVTYTHSRDFFVDAAAIKTLFEVPAFGDVITETDQDGNQRRYKVSAPNGERPWRWSDPYHVQFRIHSFAEDAEVSS